MAEVPLARSAIAPATPTEIVAGWEVSARRAAGPLTLTDCTPLAKVSVRAPGDALGVRFGRAERDPSGYLVVGSGPGEWLLLGPPGTAADLIETAAGVPDATCVDLTHGRALVRLTGQRGTALLARLSAIDLSDDVVPDGAALRTAVAALATDIVRDDTERAVFSPTCFSRPARPDQPTPPTASADPADHLGPPRPTSRSYLLHCERSSGQYLHDMLLAAGEEYGIEIDGFTTPGI